MRIAICALFIVIMVASCSKKDKVPKGILPPEKMEVVLWDILRADEFLRDYMLSKDSTLNDTLESERMYERVYKFNKISREDFVKSFDYYRTHPALMKEVMDSLNANEQKLVEVPGQSPTSPSEPAAPSREDFERRKKLIDTTKFQKKIRSVGGN
jgi:hypothetical protein